MIIRMRYEGQSGNHVRVRVFTGPDTTNCGLSGTLTIRLEDWPQFKARMENAGVELRPEGEKAAPPTQPATEEKSQ